MISSILSKKMFKGKTSGRGAGNLSCKQLVAPLAAAESTIYADPARRLSGALLVGVNG